MLWNDHSRDIQKGSHAFLGASKYSWLNYDKEDLKEAWIRSYANIMGTSLHDLAASLITNNIKLSSKDTHMVLLHLLEDGVPRSVIDLKRIMTNLIPYVSDAIGYRMIAEQPLKYSDNVFGTADAIIFDEKKSLLRIHDYKSGLLPAHLEQLEIYAALFCLEYDFKPGDINFELRIYQNGDQLIGTPKANDILPTMDKIIIFDKMLEEFKEV